MPKLTIDGLQIEIEDGLTVMQACEIAGKEIPHFCFHERLNIAGNCRACLVEMEKAPKPIASCAMPAAEGMVIYTNSPKVRKAREGVMELLLINHPLDCPICDQGGECDLQDQTFKYGIVKNRFKENKRSVKDKYMGPLVKTHMTRCIHCTRCVRFLTEVAGTDEIGTIHRAEHMEITTYLEEAVKSPLSGNIIDLCPVGALTSKPFAFKARNWELTKTESIDVMDAMGTNIRVDSRGLEVMRILPKINDKINEEWIADKARFSYDGLKVQRLDRPYVKKNGSLVEASWEEALSTVANKMKSLSANEMAAIAGTLVCCESMFTLKTLLQTLGCHNMDGNQFGYKIDTSSRANYLFNTTIEGIEKADLCLLIGTNLNYSAPVLNSRIGKMQRLGTLKVAHIGRESNQTYKIFELGDDIDLIEKITEEKHEFSQILKQAKYPMVIVGDNVYSRRDGFAVLALIHKLVEKYNIYRDDWNGFNFMHNHASMVGSLDLGFTLGNSNHNTAEILKKAEVGLIKFLYLLGADEINTERLGETFVVYQGHHGDAGANRADVIFPASAYTEKNAIYVNLEGRPQLARRAVLPPGKAKDDWEIIKDLALKLNIDFEMQTLDQVRKRMSQIYKVFENIDAITPSPLVKFNSNEQLSKQQITESLVNYYMSDTISRASITMAKCTKEMRERAV